VQEECETRRCSILYATHIFDGLEFWPTHVAYLARGQMLSLRTADEVPELKQGKLLDLVYRLLLQENERIMKVRVAAACWARAAAAACWARALHGAWCTACCCRRPSAP